MGKKRNLRVGTRRLLFCLGRVFFPGLVMMMRFEDGAAATLDAGGFQALEEVPCRPGAFCKVPGQALVLVG